MVVIKMSGESIKQEILQAIRELSDDLQAKIGSVRSELKAEISSVRTELKGNISKVGKKVDLVDAHLYILAGNLSKTKAEVKTLQDAK